MNTEAARRFLADALSKSYLFPAGVTVAIRDDAQLVKGAALDYQWPLESGRLSRTITVTIAGAAAERFGAADVAERRRIEDRIAYLIRVRTSELGYEETAPPLPAMIVTIDARYLD